MTIHEYDHSIHNRKVPTWPAYLVFGSAGLFFAFLVCVSL